MDHSLCRSVTETELSILESSIYPLQDRIFDIISNYRDQIYLHGGVVLNRFYFGHRMTQDLDMVVMEEPIIHDLLARLQNSFSIIIKNPFHDSNRGKLERGEITNNLHLCAPNFRLASFVCPYVRVYILQDNCTLELDIANTKVLRMGAHQCWPVMPSVRGAKRVLKTPFGALTQTKRGVYLENLQSIGASKLHLCSAKKEIKDLKDLVDLFYISKLIPLNDILEAVYARKFLLDYDALRSLCFDDFGGKQVMMIGELNFGDLEGFVDQIKGGIPSVVCIHASISGKVQGVGYRYAARQKAKSLGLVGYTYNLINGGVEVAVQGNTADINRMMLWFHHGPATAQVEEVDIEQWPLQELEQFDIWPTQKFRRQHAKAATATLPH